MKFAFKITLFFFVGLFLITISYPSYTQPSNMEYLYSDIGFSHACSYYKIYYSGTQTKFALAMRTLKTQHIVEKNGHLKNMVIEWAVNESYIKQEPIISTCYRTIPIPRNNSIPENCVKININELNCSYSCITGYNNITVNVTNYYPIWEANVKRGGLVNPHYNTNNLQRHSEKQHKKISKKGYIIIRYCGDFEREYIPDVGYKVEIDHIPAFNGVVYSKFTWWNNSYIYRRNITGTNLRPNMPYLVNASSFNLGSNKEWVWTVWKNTTGEALYYNDYTDYVVANDTTQFPIEIETGNSTSYNPSDVWKADKKWDMIFHINGSFVDSLGNFSGTFHGNTAYTDGYIGKALTFDGTDDYVTISPNPSYPSGEGWTWMAWFKSSANKGTIMEVKGDKITSYAWMSIMMGYETDGHIMFAAKDNGGTNAYCEGSNTWNDGNWHFVGASYNATDDSTILFIDGKIDCTGSASGQGAFTPNKVWYVGTSDNGNVDWNGEIDEIRAIMRTMSVDELNTTYKNMIGTAGYGQLQSEEIGDTTPPTCNVVSVTPSDILANSTGIYEVLINCSDTNGINIDKYIITRTVEGGDGNGIPNYWSIRPPSNDKAEQYIDVHGHNQGNILRADGRFDGKWYDVLFSDNFSYAVNDNSSIKVTITNGSSWALLNFSWDIEPSVFRSMVYLRRGNLEKEAKKEWKIYYKHPLLIKGWDLMYMRNDTNYSVCVFRNIDYIDTPHFPLDIYYCNSSYNFAESVEDSDSCGYLYSVTPEDLDNIYYNSRNSSYSKTCFGVYNNTLAGIKVSEIFYFAYYSRTPSVKAYKIRYVNGSSGTNVSFADSKVAWYSNDNGASWTQASFTPDVWFSGIVSGDQLQTGIYVEDTSGNNYTNLTLYTDDIGLVNMPITTPDILWYYSSNYTKDEFLNGTHNGIMTIRVGVSKDPNGVGTVKHSLYLTDTDGNIVYTINSSFYSPNDEPINITFNTSLVPDGIYKMNITAIADDDPNDIQSLLTPNSFIIDNVLTIINISVESKGYEWIKFNWTLEGVNLKNASLFCNGKLITYTTSGNNLTAMALKPCPYNFTVFTTQGQASVLVSLHDWIKLILLLAVLIGILVIV